MSDLPVPETAITADFPGDAPALGTPERDVWERGFATGCNETQANLKSWATECIRQSAAAEREAIIQLALGEAAKIRTANFSNLDSTWAATLEDFADLIASERPATPPEETGAM